MATTRKKGGLKPHFEDVQAHYDLSDEFFRLFLDPSQTYSCAYFERDDMTLEEAQLAKVDLALGKLGLEPGMTLLDVGCGWGATMMRALEKYDVNVVGLTLSKNQKAHVENVFAKHDSPRTKRVLLQGWEQFDEPVDRIVSIGAFEHFGKDRWDDFFAMAYKALPDDGVMLLHTITALTLPQMTAAGLPLTFSIARFVKFILTEIFPGGYLPTTEMAGEYATRAGFKLTRTQSCRSTTPGRWTPGRPRWRRTRTRPSRSSPKRSTTATCTTSPAAPRAFHKGYIDVCQFTSGKYKRFERADASTVAYGSTQ